MMDKVEVKAYIHSHLPQGVHISLNLSKDYYTQQEADEILKQSLEAWEIIKKLRK